MVTQSVNGNNRPSKFDTGCKNKLYKNEMVMIDGAHAIADARNLAKYLRNINKVDFKNLYNNNLKIEKNSCCEALNKFIS